MGILHSLGQLLVLALEIYSWVIIARVLISWVNPDPYNPVVQFLIRATEPLLGPIRRRLPLLGGLDLSPILALMVVMVAQRVVSALFSGHGGGVEALFRELLLLVHLLGTFYLLVLLIRGGINIYAWYGWRKRRPSTINLRNPGAMFIFQSTEPVCRPLRAMVPQVAGLDLTPLVAALLLLVVLSVLQQGMLVMAPSAPMVIME